MKITAAITGINGYVPDYILTNKELEGMLTQMMSGLQQEQVSKKEEY